MRPSKDASICYIRFFNAFPAQDAFDVYLDDKLLYNYFLYEDFTKYYPIPSGKHVLKLTEHHKDTILYEKKINLQRHQIYTAVLGSKFKTFDAFHIFCLEEPQKNIEPPRFGIRLNHFAHFEGATSLHLPEEPLPIRNIRYGQASSYLTRDPANYTLLIKETQEEADLATLNQQKFKSGRLYSLFFIGNGTKSFPYKSALSIDGFSYLPLQFTQKRTT